MKKCGKCGYGNRDDALTCNLCGEVLRRAATASDDAANEDIAVPGTVRKKEGLNAGPGRRVVSATWLGETGPTVLDRGPQLPPDAPAHDLWLVGQSTAPMPVRELGSISIGRDPASNQIVVPASLVSRRHAEVVRDAADRVIVRDLGSQNGTLVNGEKIEGDRVLAPGDRIEVATFTFQLVSGEPQGEEAPAATIRLTRAELDGVKAALRGKLTEVSLAEVLESLADGGKTGKLRVVDGPRNGWLSMEDGGLKHATFDDVEGEAAVRAMLRLETGGFEFSTEPVDATRTIEAGAPLKRILLDAFRELDEQGMPPDAPKS